MKTLDEVIKALELCTGDYDCVGHECPYHQEGTCCDLVAVPKMQADALHYLKAFRDAKNALDAERERTIDAYCQWKDAKEKLEAQTSQKMWVDKHFQFEISDNPPLTWDELRQMEGKPVWVEDGLENGEWYIIECFTDSGRFIGHDRYADDTVFKAVDMGNEWQAYRKERTDGKA